MTPDTTTDCPACGTTVDVPTAFDTPSWCCPGCERPLEDDPTKKDPETGERPLRGILTIADGEEPDAAELDYGPPAGHGGESA